MTREEAIILFEKQLTAAQVVLDSGFGSNPGENDSLYRRRKEMAEIALAALRGPTREQVEKMRGEWTTDGVCSRCGFDAMYYKGVPVQVRTNYCPTCGAPMTDEAVDMVMERLEEICK